MRLFFIQCCIHNINKITRTDSQGAMGTPFHITVVTSRVDSCSGMSGGTNCGLTDSLMRFPLSLTVILVV